VADRHSLDAREDSRCTQQGTYLPDKEKSPRAQECVWAREAQ